MQVEDIANTEPVSSDAHAPNGPERTVIRDASTPVFPVPETTYIHPPIHESKSQRILVVEDDPLLAQLEAGVLTAHGYTVTVVHSGELAISELRAVLPDLVVLDIELQGSMNGWDVLQALSSTHPVPVLLTTSETTSVRAYMRNTQGERTPPLEHLPKPYPIQILLKRVKRMLTITP